MRRPAVRKRGPMAGVLDGVAPEAVAGWSTAPGVVISVNGEDRAVTACDQPRPDVRERGLVPDERAGFSVPLQLEAGDIVRARTRPGDRPLLHSPRLFAPGTGWLEAHRAGSHPEYTTIHALQAVCAFRQFRPLFGHAGAVVGAALAGEDGTQWVARRGLTPRSIAAIRTIQAQVLEPAALPVPALLDEVVCEGEPVVLFEDGGRMPLDRLDGGWDPLLDRTLTAVAELQRRGAGRRLRGGAATGNHPVARLAARNLRALPGRPGPPEHRRAVLAMIATLPRLPRVLSHGDLHRKNVLVGEGGDHPRIVDWDGWDYLPAGYDAAMLLRGLPAERVARLVEAVDWPRSAANRLGLFLFTYLLRTLDEPALPASEEGQYLRERFRACTSPLWRSLR